MSGLNQKSKGELIAELRSTKDRMESLSKASDELLERNKKLNDFLNDKKASTDRMLKEIGMLRMMLDEAIVVMRVYNGMSAPGGQASRFLQKWGIE